MKDLTSSKLLNKKFLVFGCGFSGNFFAKKIRAHGLKALTSSRSKKNDSNSFIFNSENNIIPNDKIFDGVTHILSCIPPDKNGMDPVLKFLNKDYKIYLLIGLDICLPLEFMEILKAIGSRRRSA